MHKRKEGQGKILRIILRNEHKNSFQTRID